MFSSTPQQTFLIGYRSLCHEVFAKTASVTGLEKNLQEIDRGRPITDQVRIQSRMNHLIQHVRLGRDENAYYKAEADRLITSEEFHCWGAVTFDVAGSLAVAGAGSATPSFGWGGNRIQDLADKGKRMQPVYFGAATSARPGVNHLVFAWPPNCPAIENLFFEATELPLYDLPDLLARFIVMHVENVFISPNWWDESGEARRSEFLRLAAILSPDDEKDLRGIPKLVDWQVVGIHYRSANIAA